MKVLSKKTKQLKREKKCSLKFYSVILYEACQTILSANVTFASALVGVGVLF